MNNAVEYVRSWLNENRDEKYADFQRKLMPNVPPERVIGVRTPILRKFAKDFVKTDMAAEFLKTLPHEYFDENQLHVMLLSGMKDFSAAMDGVERFLPYVDNWATCDILAPKVFGKNLPALEEKCREWIKSGETYTIRFGVEMLMTHFLDAHFMQEYPELVAEVVSDEYYVNMMLAWYFATAMAKQPDAIMPYFTQKRLAPWTHNKAIQKCVESYRIDDDTKQALKALRIR